VVPVLLVVVLGYAVGYTLREATGLGEPGDRRLADGVGAGRRGGVVAVLAAGAAAARPAPGARPGEGLRRKG
jgi:hypothetical protein